MSVERVTLKDGTSLWRVRWRDASGTNRSRRVGRKRDAIAFDAEMRRLRRTGDLDLLDAGEQTLSDFAQEWTRLYAIPKLSPKTLKSYASAWDHHVLPRLGAFRLRDVTPEMIARLRADLHEAGVGDPTILRAMNVLHGMLERAVEWRRLPRNPARGVAKPANRRSRAVRPLPPSVVEHIRGVMLTKGRPRDATLVGVLAYAGVRPQEALALRWGNIRDRTVLVDEAVALGRVTDTKNRRNRTVRLLAPLAQDLAEWRIAQGRPEDTRLIFPGPDGSPWTQSQWTNWNTRRWTPILRAAGVAHARPYDLRHSFVSLLILEGLSIVEIARQAGHNPTLTLETYGHVFDELDPGQRVPAEARIRAARDELVSVSYPPRFASTGGKA